MVLSQWRCLLEQLDVHEERVTLNGHSLDISALVAIARHEGLVTVDDEADHGIAEGVKFLQSNIDLGHVVYGVNTGFGGSADTRTKELEDLQATLIRELHSGILSHPTQGNLPASDHCSFDNDNPSTCMPEPWVRASLAIRINSLSSGHSGVRRVLIQRMVDLLRKDIIPRIPLRGSISASGDLMPLSYIGGTLEGKRGITVWFGKGQDRRIVTADVALADSLIDPIKLGPKEGLAIINGTAVSTGVAALAIHDANSLALLSQILTAMSVEALKGTDESFDPFFAKVRPHSGQIEAALNIRGFLKASRLVQRNDGSEAGTLRQDRYSIRTASQWLGPILEDLQLAFQQISIECNSVTDNPLIDIDLNQNGQARILHGGNFQAKTITSAMEKARLAMQTIGQMLFAQCTEIINPRLNYGLPPNLVMDEPSQSFLFKPVDIMIAALQSELGFLSNPAGTHVQTAEMGNQALNSLGLISARYTHTAIDVLSQLAAAHLLTLCQAFDLRAMHSRFLEEIEPPFRKATLDILGDIFDDGSASYKKCELSKIPESTDSEGYENGIDGHTTSELPPSSTPIPLQNGLKEAQLPTALQSPQHHQPLTVARRLEALHSTLWAAFTKQLDLTSTMDSPQRFSAIFASLQPPIIELASLSSSHALAAIRAWTQTLSTTALSTFHQTRDTYHASPDAAPLLGMASRRMYRFVRTELGVPFLRTAMLKDGGLTTGTLMSKIYRAIREDAFLRPAMECFEDVERGC